MGCVVLSDSVVNGMRDGPASDAVCLVVVCCRIEAAGARVAPKRLPSGRSVGEPRLWLQDAGGPGLLLSRYEALKRMCHIQL